MIQTLRLLFITIVVIQNFIFCNNPYVIYTTMEFSESATAMEELYSNQVPDKYKLDPVIKYKEDYPQEDFINFLNGIDSDNTGNKYLLIIGDETIIPSLNVQNYELDCTNNQQPSDDFFNTNFAIGRLIVSNNNEAMDQINKIRHYILSPPFGSWGSELLLIADNNFDPDNADSETEINHTLYSTNIYNLVKNRAFVNTIYGIEYDMIQTSSGYRQPEVTEDILNAINSGVGIINYIGHGSETNLADELILDMNRDIDLIQTNNKPPIWIVGTCSFGQYNNTVCMAEELLKKDDAAISIIATTDGVNATPNYAFLDGLYSNLNNYISDNNDNSRLGDFLLSGKQSVHELDFDTDELYDYGCQAYRYQLYGDPALPLLFGKIKNDISNNTEFSLEIGSENLIEINDIDYDGITYLKILSDDKIVDNKIDNIKYNKPGAILFESYFGFNDNNNQCDEMENSNEINYYIPIDINSEKGNIFIHHYDINNEDLNTIQVEADLPITSNFENLFQDQLGPNIKIYNNDIEIVDNSTIFAPYNLTIVFEDEYPINLSGFNFHYLEFWIDDERQNSIILNDLFEPTCSTNGTDNFIGSTSFILENSSFTSNISYLNVQGWDIFNNSTNIRYKVNVNQNKENIFNVYNFPNPFKDNTFFTFQIKNPEPINITLDIFSKSGEKIKSFSKSENNIKAYHVIPEYGWDGKDKNSNQLNNGTYFYNLIVKNQNGKILHNKIYNTTLLK